MRVARFWMIGLVLGLGFLPCKADEEISTDKLNKPIHGLRAVGLDKNPVVLTSPEGPVTVIVFMSFDCPVSNSYAQPLSEMAEQFAEQGVKFYGVFAGEELADEIGKKAKEYQLKFPVLLDAKYQLADAVHAKTMPESFVFDQKGVLRYRGRIDDGFYARLKPNAKVTHHDLKDAVAALLDGKDVPVGATQAVGCPLIRPNTNPVNDGTVTYHRDVLPILQAHCQGCHRPGQVGPFSLLTYKQAVTWSEDIKAYTANRTMPPWKPVGGPNYANDRQMSDEAIVTLAKWVDEGCPEGDEKEAPKPISFESKWEQGEPDLVLTVPDDYHVGATGKDIFRCFVLPTGLAEDKYVVGYEVRPGNPRVVHHTLNFWDRSGKARELEAKAQSKESNEPGKDRGPGYSSSMGIGFAPTPLSDRPGVPPIGAIGGWAPGMRATMLPESTGFFLPKGADLVIQTHYHRTGKPETDRIQIGLYFAKKPVTKHWQSVVVSGMSPIATIPPGKSDYKAGGSAWLLNDGIIHNVMPHMHLIGRSIKITMTPPGEEPVTLVDIPDWEYNWQETYWFQEPIRVKAGTKLDIEALYDNSTGNPNNPFNPPRRIFFGEETTNEMLYGFLGMTGVEGERVRVSRLSPEARERLEQLQKEKEANEKPAADEANDKAQEKPKEQAGLIVPYRLTDTKHILIRAKLNGHGPYNFILDTGAPTVFLTTKVAKEAGLKAGRDGWATVNDFRLEGDHKVADLKARIEDLFQFEGMNSLGLAGAELHGVLGYTMISKYRISIDFTKDKLVWLPLDYEPKGLARIGGGGQGGLEVVGGIVKVAAGLMGVTPNYDRLPRGRIGIEVKEDDGELQVISVLENSPADQAGVKVGDRIQSLNKVRVETFQQLHREMAKLKPGTKVVLEGLRNGRPGRLEVTLDEGY